MSLAVVLLSSSVARPNGWPGGRRTLHRSVCYSASPSFSLSEREGAVLYIFTDLHN